MSDLLPEGCCPLCRQHHATRAEVRDDVYKFVCDRCGEFTVTLEALWGWKTWQDSHLISGYTREQAVRGRAPVAITTQNLGELKKHAPVGVLERSGRLLRNLYHRTRRPGEIHRFDETKDYPLGYCENAEEVRFFLDDLSERRLVHVTQGGRQVRVLVEGLAAIEIQQRANLDSGTAFVAMSFDPTMEPAYEEGIRPAVEEDGGYRAIQLRQEEYLGGFLDKALVEIKEARFVVAELTHQRNGVYLEAGYAMGLDRKVIWACRKDDLDNVHSDVRHLNLIDWESIPELRRRLADRILYSVGRGLSARRES